MSATTVREALLSARVSGWQVELFERRNNQPRGQSHGLGWITHIDATFVEFRPATGRPSWIRIPIADIGDVDSTLAQLDNEIERACRVKSRLRDLGDVANQDRLLARLTAERAALTNQLAGSPS